MDHHTLESEQQFKKAFNQGLVQLLSTELSAGTFILSLANFIQHPHLYDVNKSLILDSYTRLANRYKHSAISGLTLDDAPDDVAVMNSLIDLGLENIKASEFRNIDHERWAIYFNHLRSFRPQRMSNQKIDSINIHFNKDGFNFNKPFLNKEIFIEQELNNKKISLLFNKFPFADFHGLLVIERDNEHKQYLSEDIFHYVWEIYLILKRNIENQVIAYNSLGAGASVNHLHFQTCINNEPFSISSDLWLHNGGVREYPAECLVFKDRVEAWNHINYLQTNNIPFNLIFIDNKLYCLPRKLTTVTNEYIPQIGWFEMAGSFTIADRDTFVFLQSSQIEKALNDVTRKE